MEQAITKHQICTNLFVTQKSEMLSYIRSQYGLLIKFGMISLNSMGSNQ